MLVCWKRDGIVLLRLLVFKTNTQMKTSGGAILVSSLLLICTLSQHEVYAGLLHGIFKSNCWNQSSWSSNKKYHDSPALTWDWRPIRCTLLFADFSMEVKALIS